MATVALVAAWLLIDRFRPSWRLVLRTVWLVLALRLALFGNAAAWVAYSKILDPKDVGRRQHAALLLEARRYLAHPRPTEFLAVGSSQTWSIYGEAAGVEKDLDTFTMAGMGPVDYMLYRHYIANVKPRHVLLFLSEADLAADLTYNAVRNDPRPGFYWFRLLPRLLAIGRVKSEEGSLADLLAAEFLPEYKNAYVLRGLVAKLVREQEALGTQLLPDLPDEERLELNIDQLESKLDADNIPLQISFVRDFAAFCKGRGIELILVEGQYHPRASTPGNRALNAIVRHELASLAATASNVTFISREETYGFTEEDFRDGVHVRPEAGMRFTADLLVRLRLRASGGGSGEVSQARTCASYKPAPRCAFCG